MSPKAKRRTRSRPLVFISHSAVDSWIAHRIAESIGACGAEAFLSEQLEAGDDFAEQIRDALGRSKELVAYLTPWALERPWVWLEIGAAWFQGLRLAFVLHGLSPEELRQHPRFPAAFVTTNFVDINDIEAGYLAQLRRRMSRRR